MFEQIATLVAKQNDIKARLENDQKVYDRIPSTMAKRRTELAQVEAQLAELKKQLDTPAKK